MEVSRVIETEAIVVWDLRDGRLLRAQPQHKGPVTTLVFSSSINLLFSGSLDGNIGVWSDKGMFMQFIPTGWSVFCMCWSPKRRILAAGGPSVVHVYRLNVEEARRLRRERQALAAELEAGSKGRAASAAIKAVESAGRSAPSQTPLPAAPPAAASGRAAADGAAAAGGGAGASGVDVVHVLRPLCPPLKGWRHPRRQAALEAAGRRRMAGNAPGGPPLGSRVTSSPPGSAERTGSRGRRISEPQSPPGSAAPIDRARRVPAPAGASSPPGIAGGHTGQPGTRRVGSPGPSQGRDGDAGRGSSPAGAGAQLHGGTWPRVNRRAHRVSGRPASAPAPPSLAAAGAVAGAGTAASVVGAPGGTQRRALPRQREEEFYDVCHTDLVTCMVLTDHGRLVTGGYDHCICLYDVDKLDRPSEAFHKAHARRLGAVTSLAADPRSGAVVSGSTDGALRVWSHQGRCMDSCDHLGGGCMSVAYVGPTHTYWCTARGDRLAVVDPRDPANVTPYVREPSCLDHYQGLPPALAVPCGHVLRSANGVSGHWLLQVALIVAPAGTDLLLAATKQRQVVVWRHNQCSAHRVFRGEDDMVQCVMVARVYVPTNPLLAGSALELPPSPRGDPATGSPPSLLPPLREPPLSGVLPAGLLDVAAAVAGQGCGEQEAVSELQEVVFSSGGEGRLLQWRRDADAACDVFRPVEQLPGGGEGGALCLLHCPRRQWLLAGCADGTIRLHELPSESKGAALEPAPPRLLEGHAGAVVALALLKGGQLLVSAGADRSLRVWDPEARLQLAEVPEAQDTPIQCADLCGDAQQLAVCGQGNRVAVWSFAPDPLQPRLHALLDHSAQTAEGGDAPPATGGAADVLPARATNMRWLTRSDVGGGSAAAGGIVAEAIATAGEDVPEVTQVRWAGFAGVWVTTADDGMMRTWTADGALTSSFAFRGGSCCCLAVDEANEVLLAAMMDRAVYVYALDDPLPLATFRGHADVVRSIGCLPSVGFYVTASWDGTLRLWTCPRAPGGMEGADATVALQRARVQEQDRYAPSSSDSDLEGQEAREDAGLALQFLPCAQDGLPLGLSRFSREQEAHADGAGTPTGAGCRPRAGARNGGPVGGGGEGRDQDGCGGLASKLAELDHRLRQELQDVSLVDAAVPPSWGRSHIKQTSAVGAAAGVPAAVGAAAASAGAPILPRHSPR